MLIFSYVVFNLILFLYCFINVGGKSHLFSDIRKTFKMVVEQSNIDHIMRGLQSTEGVRLHNHRKKLRQRFDIIKKLGQGTYGKVQLGINKETGQEVAIKAIKKCKIETEADLVRIRREIQIMSSVRHPNIIHIYEVFENREKMVLVMEYAAGGELYDFLSERKVLEEPEARRIFRQISTAVYYCHKHKICHRDLKLENILLDEHGNAKIADFGLSNVYDEQRLLNSFCGSPLYASPEIVKGTPYHGPEVDCWSLGVLLYTLVYGAMPFDGSNFKRLVKQISQGVYFEPKNPSSASPLIREMLTVNPQKRATIEQICSHRWVNQGFNVSCLDIAEDLANQTPVRLDLLLSLAPPPENSEKLVVTDDQSTASQDAPTRSLSVGSFMELDPNTEQRIRDFVAQEVPSENAEKTVKRKLEADASETSIKKEGARKKERTKTSELTKGTDQESANKTEDNVVMDVDAKSTKVEEKEIESITTDESAKKVEAEAKTEDGAKAVEQGADSVTKDKPTRKSVKVVKKKTVTAKTEGEKKDETESSDAKAKVKKKKKEAEAEPVGAAAPVEASVTPTEPKKEVAKTEEVKPEDKEEAGKEIKRESATRKSQSAKVKEEKSRATTPTEESPSTAKLGERRKSKIFETAEKFMANDPKSPTVEKPKKVFIPGVKVSDFAKAFERKSSLTSTPSVKTSQSRKSVPKEPDRKSEDAKKSPDVKPEVDNSSQSTDNQTEAKPDAAEASEPEKSSEAEEYKPTEITDEKLKKLKDSARNIIANALVEEERKKMKKQIMKPPMPRTKSEDADSKKPLTLQIGKETATVQVHSPENTKFLFEPTASETSGENKENIEQEKGKEKKTAKVEITLRSNSLPRGVTSKAELQLRSPQEKPGSFRTEVEHRVGDPHAKFTTQRSEVAFPVSAAQRPIRSMSLEPEVRRVQPQKERIIPIQMEDGGHKEENEARDRVRDLESGSRTLPYRRTMSQRSASLSRQSTQDSDTEAAPTVPGEAIKKSPREFIIPIAVEGGGYVTPRATSLEPSETLTSKRGIRPFSRKISLWSDNGSEDESPFSTLQRHSSRDLDEPFRLHRLRSTRPARSSVDKADSGSGSEEEEEDDDGFEILTAENLFSTLLSRVRSLTQRLNVEGGIRPGFPSSRLMNHFGPSDRLFSNFHQPLHTRLSERPEFGRSLSRDMENGLNRWSRGDLNNSDSTRSMTRDSKLKRPESDTESISDSSSRRKQKSRDEKKSKRSSSQIRASVIDGPEQVETRLASRVPVPRGVTPRTYHRQISDSEVLNSAHSSLQTLPRTMSLKSKKRSDRKLEESEDKVKDFYDILAEKYGITNVKRYDLSPSSSRWNQPTESAEDAQPEVLPPIPPKKEEEKCRTPSEKLAAVLNKLESGKSSEKKGKSGVKEVKQEELRAVDKDRLAGLSPQALDLYEKTLALYQKKKDEEVPGKTGKSGIPRRTSSRRGSDVNSEGEKSSKRETPEKSVLSKYLQGVDGNASKSVNSCEEYFKDKKLKHYGSLRSRNNAEKEGETKLERRKSTNEADSEKQKSKRGKDGEEPAEEKSSKNKLLTSIDRKFDKFRSDKKYVDKAIRSLRESSLGPKDVSENVLIKRAVSMSDCSTSKAVPAGRIQSTVNSVLGMFKKKEEEVTEKAEVPKEESKIPQLRNRNPPLRLNCEKAVESSTRRASFINNSRNDATLINSPSLIGWDDSSSLKSPDSESFDSWSNCSDVGSPEDFYQRSRHSSANFDEMSTESVGERIRRKSFYTRFNERKKPRRSSILEGRKRYDSEESGHNNYTSEYPSKLYDDTRPKPFYKTKQEAEKPVQRKTSLDWPKYSSHSSSLSGYATLSRSYIDSRKSDSLYRTGSNDLERALSPIRPFSPTRALSPSRRNQNSFD